MNLFDGKDGKSDGTKDGYSSAIPSGIKSVAVHGVFDGATVSIQRYSEEIGGWFMTQAEWTISDVFQGLEVESGAKYRLIISKAGGSTKLYAEF